MAAKRLKEMKNVKSTLSNRRLRLDPTMSDKLLVLNFEDCIGVTFGGYGTNLVDFKMLETVLYLLARHMRMLEQDIEIKIYFHQEKMKHTKKKIDKHTHKKKHKKIHSLKVSEVSGEDGSRLLVVEDDEINHVEEDDEPTRGGSGRGVVRRRRRRRIGSIDVVTPDEFRELESWVNRLLTKIRLVPLPTVSSSVTDSLASGTATFSSAMEDLQVKLRMHATEQAMHRMAGVLTNMAVLDALPEGMLHEFNQMHEGLQLWGWYINATIEPGSRSGDMTETSATEPSEVFEYVTPEELEQGLSKIRNEIRADLKKMTAKFTKVSDSINDASKTTEAKIMNLQFVDRIEALEASMAGYVQLLNQFDTERIDKFHHEITQFRDDLDAGLFRFNTESTINTEELAVRKLKQAFEVLEFELEKSTYLHSEIVNVQDQLASELRRVIYNMENAREQKADKVMLPAELKNKVELSQVTGFLDVFKLEDFQRTMDEKIQNCNAKCQENDEYWRGKMEVLERVSATKADYVCVVGTKELAEQSFKQLEKILELMQVKLGDPQVAVLKRKLSMDGNCGICATPALIFLHEPAPPLLPPLRAARDEDERPQEIFVNDIVIPPILPSIPQCKRWIGGSHTKLANPMAREPMPKKQFHLPPTKKYVDKGLDGRLYMLEELISPCLNCNQILVADHGGGDRPRWGK